MSNVIQGDFRPKFLYVSNEKFENNVLKFPKKEEVVDNRTREMLDYQYHDSEDNWLF